MALREPQGPRMHSDTRNVSAAPEALEGPTGKNI